MLKSRFTRIGFILAASGSAVGLGNIWKFPYITGENGGGAFVLVYLLSVFFIGMSVFIAESLIGKKANSDSVTAFETLSLKNGHRWKFTGLSFITSLLILSYYPIVLGWVIHYIYLSLTTLPSTVQEAEGVFLTLLKKDYTSQVLYFTVAMIVVGYTIAQGVKSGIEKFNKFLMPSLILLLIGMLVYSFSLDGFSQAFTFLFLPNFEKFSGESVIIALGHAFLTLSIGMAIILTYSSSLKEDSNIFQSSVIVVIMDTLIALVAGLIVFSILFTSGAQPSQGPGLVFITLPAIFYEFGSFGNVIAILFFVSLLFAGLTSSISVLEPTVKFLEHRWKVTRAKASYYTVFAMYLFGMLSLFSNITEFNEMLIFWDKKFFDWLDFITSSIMLPLGGLGVAIFVGYIMDKDVIKAELLPHMGVKLYNLWMFTLRYVVPVSILAVMFYEVG
ncbi:MAG: sodium-dependent transporter [Campylobacterales bacterium]|nr:sodium-dependent transporter [Campylobacterales bacterium]